MRQNFFSVAVMGVVAFSGAADARGIRPGLYQIGNPSIQNICLKADGTWYGTTFNFGGHWINDPQTLHGRAIIYGTYGINGGPSGYANDSMSVIGSKETGVQWLDWFDDLSYQQFLTVIFVRLRGTCGRPFTGENTHAATQGN